MRFRRPGNPNWSPWLRTLVAALVGISLRLPSSVGAQQPPLPTTPDTNRMRRILQAADERDSTAGAFDDGFRTGNAKVRALAHVELARTRDPKFAARDSFPKLPDPPKYAEPAWRLRFRALGAKPLDCALVKRGLADSAWAVRLRVLDVATSDCADPAFLSTAKTWASTPPRNGARKHGGVSWQPAAHAIVALARLEPREAAALLPPIVASPIPWLRAYAAHAAAILGDTAKLRTLARDVNDNVKEAALDELAKLDGHPGDMEAIAALSAHGYQAVRAAARLLKGSPHGTEVARAAVAAAARLRNDSSETSRDARLAVLERVNDFASADEAPSVAALATDYDCVVATAASKIAQRLGASAPPHCTPMPNDVPEEAVRLAFGESVHLRVTLADSSGGGSFIVRLRGDAAPVMAGRVLALVNAHWYDNRAWFRVEPDFVIEGGGPGANEYVGDKRFMRDELSSIPQVRGTVGMSTRGHDTGDAQWFINLRDNLRLTRDYTTFGEVISGMDVVDGILEGDVIQSVEVITGQFSS
jgi:cyclophilin family peptidyl-prolyl cis-trans isomerase